MTGQNGRVEEIRRVKLAVSGLDSLSVLPTVAAEALRAVFEPQFSPADLVDLVEASPTLAVSVLTLAQQQGIDVQQRGYSFSQVLNRLQADELRSAFLSLDICHISGFENVPSECVLLPREDLIVHSLAVALCAKQIARSMVVGTDTQLAYMAGLLHDIGKLALHQLMPLGFAGIVGQAKRAQTSSIALEQAYLGIDHSVIGKYLAKKWCLPQQVQMAVWLHHSDIAQLSDRLPYAQMARIVHCADTIVNSLDSLGQSGNFNRSIDIQQLADTLSVNANLLIEIRSQIRNWVDQKALAFNLDMADPLVNLCRISHRGAAKLSQINTASTKENKRLGGLENQLEFIEDFLLGIQPKSDVFDLVDSFARRWQRFYQTGKVCIFFASFGSDNLLEAVLIEDLNTSRRLLIDHAQYEGHLEKRLAGHSALQEVADDFDWLWDQIGCEFQVERSKFISLSKDHCAGLLFELNYPGDIDRFADGFLKTAQIGRLALELALVRQEQEQLAEDFAALRLAGAGPVEPTERPLSGEMLAEVAAGFAHELNNPLSVISGRAQLLTEGEQADDRLRSLKLIEDNAHDVSRMVEDLISYAEPAEPRPQSIEIVQVIEEAVQLAGVKSASDDLVVSKDVADESASVYVDSGQIVSAVANILVNAIESYRADRGPIEVETGLSQSGRQLQVCVRDYGCGMDADTVRHAPLPFFSAKPAGRKRGMGLAYAARIIGLNHGELTISSQVNQGSTVTILLPLAS
jgi:putative nucleotidyltransferase with HDIG domain